MNKNTFKAALIGALLLLVTGLGFSQTTGLVPQLFTTTTASLAVAATDNYVVLASMTGVTVSPSPQTALVIEGEIMTVNSVDTTNSVAYVSRTQRFAHPAGVTVFVGRPNWFAPASWSKPLIPTRPTYIQNIPISALTLGSDTSTVNGTIFTTEIFVPTTILPAGLGVSFGTTTSSDKYIVAIFNAGGTLVAYSTLAGTAYSGTANTIHEIAFQYTSVLPGPARYWACIQANGTTSHIRTVSASTYLLKAKSATGTFGTLSLTPPTTFTADTGPICYIY